jgi:cell division protein ZapB
MTHSNPADVSPHSPPSVAPGADSQGMEREIRLEIALVAERVERLLLRHDELHRTNVLLSEQVRAITADRDSLRSRLSAARARVEALIERLPDNSATPSHTQPGALG